MVPRARIVELNAQAADFFSTQYPDSWVPGYLISRLGTDLAGDDRFTVGYAADSWTALTNHLRRQGATDEEIVGAGLGSYASTGRVIDRFRDRLVVPIQATGPGGETEIRGWIGRRNPRHDADDGDTVKAGPKYLNTSQTDLFTKGHELYGLAENAEALAAGAAPVLVEGPIDALAVTLAGDGAYVGVAPLGTAFTDTQADTLRPYIGPDRPGVIVATDADHAGRRAAHRAFWQLAARGDNPRHPVIDDCKDPAALLQTHGPHALKARLDTARPLAETVIADRTGTWGDRLGIFEGSVYACRAAVQVVAALPVQDWPRHVNAIIATTGVSRDVAIKELSDAHTAWSTEPQTAARQHEAERLPRLGPGTTFTGDAPPRSIPPAPVPQRWANLADSLVPDLSRSVGWPALAASLDRAAQTGYDVAAQLPGLVANRPLPEDHIARSLELRLATAWPESIVPLSWTTRRAAQRDADTPTRSRAASAHGPVSAMGASRRSWPGRNADPAAKRKTEPSRGPNR